MKLSLGWRCVAGVLGLPLGWGSVAQANPILGYVDNFNSGNPDGWGANFVGAAQLTTGGGPAGATDPYAVVTAVGGSGPGNALAMNTLSSAWAGNYQVAGVNTVSADLLSPTNNTTTPLQIRVVLFGPTGGKNNFYSSLVPYNLPNDGAWHHALFSLSASNLVSSVGNVDSYQSTITGVSELMLRYAVTATQVGGTSVSGTLGVDNITAIPEPTGLVLVPLGALSLLRRSRRRGR